MPMARVLITGGTGMLGRALARRLQAGNQLWAPGSRELDIRDAAAVDAGFARFRPDTVIHCAALTAVDRCEGERELAFGVNRDGTANVARACRAGRARLLAISTDYVFAGDLGRPYREDDATGPRTAYGQSKLAGEEAVRELCPDHLILRVSWLYGPGGPSFLHTMRRLLTIADQGPLPVVDDQIGNPTSTEAVAGGIGHLLATPARGVVHLTCAGETTWFGFAREIAARLRLPRALRPCTTAEVPRPAPRPADSRLDHAALRALGLPAMPDWRLALGDFLRDFPDG
jgi:dTDP-4-dehydrorhamnose reductase